MNIGVKHENLTTWLNDYREFEKWCIKNKYKAGLTLDRIDVDGNYCPENCRFVDLKMQANNRRTNNVIFYQSQTKTLKQWCDILKINYSGVYSKIKKGKTYQEIFDEVKRL